MHTAAEQPSLKGVAPMSNGPGNSGRMPGSMGQPAAEPSGLRSRLRWRIVALMGALLMIAVMAIGVRVYSFARQNEQKVWAGRQQEATRHAANSVAGSVQRMQTTLSLVGALDRESLVPSPVAEGTTQESEVLAGIIQQEPGLLEIIRVTSDGDLVAAAYQDAPVLANQFTIRQSSWFQAARAGEMYLGNVQVSPNQQPYILMATSAAANPVSDAPATGADIVAARVSLAIGLEIVQNAAFGNTGQVAIVTRKGDILAHTNPDLALGGMSLAGHPEMAATATDSEWTGEYLNVEGTSVVGQSAPVPGTDLTVITELAMSEVHENSRTVLRIFGGRLLLFGIAILVAMSLIMERVVIRPVEALRAGAEHLGRGDLEQRSAVRSRDELGQLATSLNRMAAELQTVRSNLEKKVADRTVELERRSAYLRTAADVSRIASSILDADQLVRQVAEVILERFGLYHVSLFQIQVEPTRQDEEETPGGVKWAVYWAGAGAGGPEMLTLPVEPPQGPPRGSPPGPGGGFRLQVGGPSLIGWSTAHGQAKVVNDVHAEVERVDHPLLPATRSEAALPLIIRGQVIGCLSVQSDRLDAFDPDIVLAHQIIADQVAVAIDNARLFGERQEALQATRRAYSELSQQAWVELVRGRRGWGYRYAQHAVSQLAGLGATHPEMAQARTSGEIIDSAGDEGAFLAVPLLVRGQPVGVLGFQKEEQIWTEDERLLLKGLVDQVAGALESARLFQDVQRRAARDQITAQVTARMRETLDVETVLKTAIGEMGAMLGLPRVEVRMLDPLAQRPLGLAQPESDQPGDSGRPGESGRVPGQVPGQG